MQQHKIHRLEFMPSDEDTHLFREVFSSSKGKEVLNILLGDMGVFGYISDSDEDRALNNYGIRLLKILAGGEPSKDNIQDFAIRMMKQDLKKEGEE